jgi:hypothetical protein
MTTKNTKSVATTKSVWFVTGCSTGFGRELASHVLDLGYRKFAIEEQVERGCGRWIGS